MQEGYTVVLSPDPGGGYSVTCPAMPGAISQGESRREAIVNVAEAMAGWLEVATAHGDAPLAESADLVAAEVGTVLGYRAEEGWDLVVETAVVEPGLVAAA